MAALKLYIDGASRGNPGHAGAGAVVFDEDGIELARSTKYLGSTLTNNFAEYQALLLGLALASKHGSELEVYSDSQLLVRQMNGEYRVKNPDIKKLFDRAKALLVKFERVHFSHVRRENNKLADQLANEAIDNKS